MRENFRSALKVADLFPPERRLIIRKPIRSPESEGIVADDRLSHGGGHCWNADSPEYRTLLEWIQGAKVPLQ